MTSGGSHTNFDSAAFTVGAVGGAATIGAALVQGFANYRQQQADRWANWNVQQLRTALDLSESLRAHEATIIDRLERENAWLQQTVECLERQARDVSVSAARRLPRR